MKETEEKFNWGRAIIWILAIIVLFVTNPKQPAKHRIVIENKVDHIVSVTDAEINRLILSSGGTLYRSKSSKSIRAELMKGCNSIKISNLGLLSFGSTDHFTTIGILGMVFELTGLFVSDQDYRDAIASEIDW